MSVVIVRLMGGLGNQLFQYATGYALSRRLDVPLLVDRSFLDVRADTVDWTLRDLELDAFQVPLNFATPAMIGKARKVLDSRFHRLLSHWLPSLYPWQILVEDGERHMPRYNTLRAPAYLQGHWQSQRYFEDVADELRGAMFLPREEPDEVNARLRDLARQKLTASIHVRRGDYVTAVSNGYHHTCGAEYYRESAAWMVRELGVEHFLVFSDEPDRVLSELDLPHPHTLVSHNTGRSAHWDMWLMRQCAHHIIANSSFSWWGAWLNTSPGKVVIAPKRWFTDPALSAVDLLPVQWLKR
jgi:hypothetical protein